MSTKLRNWHFDIDIIGGCNLACPTCPVGNADYAAVPKGYMKPALLEQIIEKARAECGRPTISLYNWTEPFLHPRLSEMISIVKKHGLECTISSNLNILRNLEGVVNARPDVIRVSVSGFYQNSYKNTHAGGNIDIVKRNMERLASENRKIGSPITLTVLFHRYKDNADEEVLMREFAERLGYKFKAIWAYFMPIEKLFEMCEQGSTGEIITDEDRSIISKLALPIQEALNISKSLNSSECGLRDNQFALTVKGDVMLCCATYDQRKFMIANYMETSLQDLQLMKHKHSACDICVRNGINNLSAYEPRKQLDELAFKTVKAAHPNNVHADKQHWIIREKLSPAAYFIRDSIRKVRGTIKRK